MMRKLLLWLPLMVLFFVLSSELRAQDICPPGTPPFEDCNSACVFCNFSGSGGSTANFSGGSAPGFCGVLHNDQWVGFVASTTSASFIATPAGCTNGEGIQIGVYADCGSGPVACNGGTGNPDPLPLSGVPLVIGQSYYIVVDGYNGDICNFSVSISPPQNPVTPGPVRPIQGPRKLCPNGSGVYSVPPIPGAETVTWNGPPGSTINGQSPPVTLPAAAGTSVTVTFGNVGGAISVQPANPCRTGPVQTLAVTVAPIPPTNLAQETACAPQDFPYTLPWGEEIPFRPPGKYTFQTTIVTDVGCDSTVIQPLRVAQSYTIGPILRYVCSDNPTITICGETFTGPNPNIEQNCKTFLECDSIIKVDLRVLAPIAKITTLGNNVISCTNKEVILRSLASPAPSIKTWRNPAGTSLGTGDTLRVIAPGRYILESRMTVQAVTCTKRDTIDIVGNTTPPTVAASANGQIGCGGNQVTISTTNNATNPTFAWSGPNGFSSSSATPQVTLAGTYTVVITNATNGCTKDATVTVTGSTTPPSNTLAVSGPITCANQATGVTITTTTSVAATYNWAGPSGFVSTIANPVVLNAGIYTVTVTGTGNNCTSTATVAVDLDKTPPSPNVTSNGVISCPTPNVPLTATPSTGVTYNWNGPNSFSGTTSVVQAPLSGTYTVTVTNTGNGCTATATATVSGNTTPPQVSTVGGTVSCKVPAINITGSSSTTGATFSWAGPSGFTSTQATPNVNAVGTYTLTVTGPNNCTSTMTALVNGDFTLPQASANGGIITCGTTSTTITGSSSTTGATFAWTGPTGSGFTASTQNAVASLPGNYTLVVTGPNGCTQTATATVTPDSAVPVLSATGGTLNCTNPQIALSASATLNANVEWTDPTGTPLVGTSPTVNTPGIYRVLATNPNNGCTATADIEIKLDNQPPVVALVGGVVSCKEPTISISASAPSPVSTWAWAGPNTFTSAQQNPNNVTEPGTYTLTATGANGCPSTATVQVLEDKVAPTVNTQVDILTCTNATRTIATTSSTNSTYNWSGPTSFTSALQNPQVTVPGDYTVTVKADNNGCTSTRVVTVQQDTVAPRGVVATGDTLTCIKNSVGLTSNSTTANVTYQWAGPGGFNPAVQNPTNATIKGTYTVVVKSQNGCTTAVTTTVEENRNAPTASNLPPQTLTCALKTVTIDATPQTPQSTLQSTAWSGPNGFNSTLEDPAVTEPGLYNLTVTARNGCTSQLQVNVSQNIAEPGATAFGGEVDCVIDSLALDGATPTANSTFSWSGPLGYTASTASPIARNVGTYTLTVTGPNGCTTTATAEIISNVTLPDVAVVKTNDLDCDDLRTTLQASSQTVGATYTWTGPGLLSPPTSQAANVDKPGTYTVAVRAPNGCVSREIVEVTQDIAAPNLTATGNTISCANPEVTISAVSTTPDVTYLWDGPPGFSSDLATPTVSGFGLYSVLVTGLNACTSTATVTVDTDLEAPQLSNLAPQILTCARQTVTIDATVGTPTSPLQSLNWAGPGGFGNTTEDPSVTVPGDYVLIATSENGCKDTLLVKVEQDIAEPELSAEGATITCKDPSVTITGNSNTQGVTYLWTGPAPANQTFTVAKPLVSTPGVWTLVAEGPNGCTSSKTVDVSEDVLEPGANAVSANNLDCDDLSSQLTAGSPTTNVTYAWTGPNLSATNIANPLANDPGTYRVVITGQNGCTSTAEVNITEDITEPGVDATGNTITCATPEPVIGATSPTQGATFKWSGPGGFNKDEPNPTVSLAGTYTVLAVGPNGCTSTATTTVDRDANIPDIQALTPDTLTCTRTSSQVQVNIFAPAGVTVDNLSWVGPNNFTSDQSSFAISTPGTYRLTITSSNGCKVNADVTVLQNIAPPGATATAGTLTCAMPSFTLQGSSSIPAARAAWDWAGPTSFTSTQRNPTATEPGIYTLTVRDKANGCTSTATAELLADKNAPEATASVVDTLMCKKPQVELTGASSMTGTFLWTGPGITTPSLQNPVVGAPGTYSLTVTADLNGCTDVATITVAENKVKPDLTTKGDTVSCNRPTVPVSATSTAPGAFYKWAGPNSFTANEAAPNVTNAGTYSVTVTGYNGCTATATALIANDKAAPTLSGQSPKILTCNDVTVNILASVSSLSPVQAIAWTGPSGYTSNVEDPNDITTPGIYTLLVTPANGCTSTTTVEVKQDIATPAGPAAIGGELNCNKPSISISANTTTQNVTYNWAGPGGISFNNQQSPSVTNPGTYTVTIINNTNGCTATATALVTEDPALPNISAATDTLTCSRKTVVLDANSTTPGVTYAWSGPNNFNSTVQDPSTDRAGLYSVVVTGTNGCKSTFTLNVAQDIAAPSLRVLGDTITCATNTGTATAISTTPGVTYSWTGPSAFASSLPTPTVTEVGTYTVVVTARNGCQSTATAIISPDQNAPQVTVRGGTISCAVPQINLTATANVPVTWSWTGPSFTSAIPDPQVTVPGTYTLVATSTANGCSVTRTALVADDTKAPEVSIPNPRVLTCTVTEVTLSANIAAPGTYSYAWATQGGNISSGQQSPQAKVTVAAPYSVTVTNTVNGCTSIANTVVKVDPATPSGVAETKRNVSCFGQNNGAYVIDSVKGGTPPVLFSLDGAGFSANRVFSGLKPGVHTLALEDANGCEFSTTFTIEEPAELLVNLGPDTTIFLGDEITLSLDDVVNYPDRVATTRITPASIDTLVGKVFQPKRSLRYALTVVDSNGCRASDDRTVIVDRTRFVYIPNAFAPESDKGNELLNVFAKREEVARVKSFRIFDRWGNMVHEYTDFEIGDQRAGWPGTHGNRKVVPGVFVAVVEILFIDGETEYFKRDVTVTR